MTMMSIFGNFSPLDEVGISVCSSCNATSNIEKSSSSVQDVELTSNAGLSFHKKYSEHGRSHTIPLRSV